MNEEMVQQLMATAERLANAAESLDRVLGRLDAQQEALNTKVDRIVAAVEERPSYEMAARGEGARHLQERVAELEKSNADLKAQAARMARKTLPPMVSAILAKSCGEAGSEKIGQRRAGQNTAELECGAADCGEVGAGAGGDYRVEVLGLVPDEDGTRRG